MSGDVLMEKERVRRELNAAANLHSEEERRLASVSLCERLLAAPVWRAAHRILAFHPMRLEPDIRPVLDAALREEKVLALPRFLRAEDRYEPVRVRDLEGDLQAGVMGILEPRAECPVIPINHLDLVLVPGLGFDLRFGRVGRGRGYYDRLLAGLEGGNKCGVTFDWQVILAVPMQAHDVPVDFLVTPTRWLSRVVGERGCE
ncbi:MAG: 5-formyltetrahydrofolate cyclo-ligase [Verrucomicrobiales bacterium]|nr:5-formyltetrahydrofolate cyclo-ligase [Verrucomicrobiales bacterium]